MENARALSHVRGVGGDPEGHAGVRRKVGNLPRRSSETTHLPHSRAKCGQPTTGWMRARKTQGPRHKNLTKGKKPVLRSRNGLGVSLWSEA